MKIFTCVFLGLSSLGFSQNPMLFEYEWQLTTMTIDAVEVPAISNSEVSSVFLTFNEESSSLQTKVCNEGFADLTFNEDDTYTITSLGITLIFCNVMENNFFEISYFSNFFDMNNPMITYIINETENSASLLLVSSNNNTALYNGELLTAKDFKANQLTLYPNPTKDFVNIGNNLNTSENWNWEIYDYLGRTTATGILLENKAVNVENLQTGIYLLKVSNGKKSSTKKFIKE